MFEIGNVAPITIGVDAAVECTGLAAWAISRRLKNNLHGEVA